MSEKEQVKTQATAGERNGEPVRPAEADAPSDAEASEAPLDAGAPVGDEAVDASEEERSPEEQIAALEAELEELNDRLLRQVAEFQNFRRRVQREKEKLYQTGKKDAILPMLEVLDDFERSIEATEQLQEQEDVAAAYESLKSGVEMIFQKFLDALKGVGVEPIEAEGKPFDEREHEAMMQQPAPDGVDEGTVLQELRRGYRLGDQVLRHSRVIVAS